MKHTTSRLLFAYWDTVRGERVAAERDELQPTGMRHVLADTFILGRDGARSPDNVRLAGTRLCALFGFDLKGARLGSFWPPEEPDLDGFLEMMAEDGVGVVAGLVGTTQGGVDLPLELLLLPLRHGGRLDRRVLGALSPASVPSWAGLTPLARLATASVRIIDPRRERSLQPTPDLALLPARGPVLVVHEGGRA